MSEQFDLLSLVPVDLNSGPALTKTSIETAEAMKTRAYNYRKAIEDTLEEQCVADEMELKSLPVGQPELGKAMPGRIQ